MQAPDLQRCGPDRRGARSREAMRIATSPIGEGSLVIAIAQDAGIHGFLA
jgi:hypothetical protein